jgi:hypothetical protein
MKRTFTIVFLSLLAISSAGFAHQQSSSNGDDATNDGLSTTCKFTSGLRAGQVQHWPRGTPGLTPAPIGQSCTDGKGSTGIAIADPQIGPDVPKPQPTDGLSTTCKFTSGPRAGQVKHWPRNTPGLTPARIGAPCTDGVGNSGIAIADSDADNGDNQ